MGEGAQQSYLSWQSTQRRYECTGKKGTGATRGLIPYHGEQVPIYSTNKRDTWRVRAASSSGNVCVMSVEYIQSTQLETFRWGKSRGRRAVALQEVKVTEKCELHTSLSHQQWFCRKVKDVCLLPIFSPTSPTLATLTGLFREHLLGSTQLGCELFQ